ncbi:MAG: FUSC family protein [Acetobacteraceae bacterium]
MIGAPWRLAARQALTGSAFERLHPVRLLDALVCTGFVLAAAAGGALLPHPGHSLVPAILGGLMAFNGLLFFAPSALALYPRRFPPILIANVVPIPLVTLLYAANPLLADLALILLAPAAVLARAHGTTAAALTMIIAINTLVALLFAGAPDMARLGAECGVIGTFGGFAADATATLLLRAAGMGAGRRLLIGELARFLAALSAAWRSEAAWPTARLSAHAAHLRQLVADLTLAATAARAPPPWPGDVLPPAELIEAISRTTAGLHGSQHLPKAVDAQMRATLAALVVAADADALGRAAPDVEALRGLACSRDLAADDASPAELLGVALLLSDLVQASLLKAGSASPPPASAPRAVSVIPDATSSRLALQAGVCMVLALALMHTLPFPKPYWLPLTTFILVSASFGESARKSLDRILGTGSGLIIGQLIWMAAAGRNDVLTLAIGVSLVGLFSARNAAYRVLLFWLTVMLAVVLHMADAPLSFYAARLADTLLGTAIVLLVTGLLLPVRTDDVLRTRLATLLSLGAERLRDDAAALRTPGPHRRAGMLDEVAGSAQALHDLAAAETLENGLLRRPRGQPAQRQEAADRLVRVLIYVDQLLPVLSGSRVTEETLALVDEMAAATRDASPRIGAGAEPARLDTLRARGIARTAALGTAFASGALDAIQLEAERRLLSAMDGLLNVLEALEATMAGQPATIGGVMRR